MSLPTRHLTKSSFKIQEKPPDNDSITNELLKYFNETMHHKLQITLIRRNLRRWPIKQAVPKKFAISGKRHLHWCIGFFFPVNSAKSLRTPILKNICERLVLKICLSPIMPLVSFNTPWKHQKTSGFLMFLGGIERDWWHEMVNKILDLGHYPEFWNNGLIFSIYKSPDLLRHHKEVWKQKFKFLLF